MSEPTSKVPNSWEIVTIGTLCDLKNGRAFKPSDWTPDGLKIVRIQNLNNPEAPYNHYSGEVRDRFRIDTGDLLFAWSGTPGTSFGAHIWAGGKAVLNQHIFRVDFDETVISKKYFMYAINLKLNELIEKAHGGVGLRHVTKGKFEQTEIQLPPHKEQLRLVEAVEELLSDLDKGTENLKTAREQLTVFRQAVFKYAFEGKFTKQWRKGNSNTVESTEQPLAQVKRHRDAQFQHDLKEWNASVTKWKESGGIGPCPSKPSQFKPPEPINVSELAKLPDIPDSWQYVRLSEIAEIGSGMSVSKARKLLSPIEVPYLRVANVQRGFLNLDEIKTMRIERFQLPSLVLKQGDVLFNEGGDRDKLGRGWVWDSQIEPCITQNHVFRASPFSQSSYHSKWISYWGNAFGQRYFETEGKQTTNLASINKGVLSKFPVPLAPFKEQEETVNMIDSQLAIVDNLENEVASSLIKSEALRQSILKKGFSGQLVEQDPTDEPASVLLERIKAERAKPAANDINKKTTHKKKATAA